MTNFTKFIFFAYLSFFSLIPAQNLFKPNNLSEVQDLIIKAKEKGQKIRFVGTNYSSNAIVKTDGYLISTKKFNKILKVDQDRKTIRVESGIIIKDLLEYLAKNFKLTLPDQSLFIYQTLGGAIATATHGSGHKTLYSDFVISYELIDGNGQRRIITRDDSDDFDAVSSNLGALGFLYAITLQCVPVFILKHERIMQNWETTKLIYRELFSKHAHIFLALHADSKQVLTFVWDNTDIKKPTNNTLFYLYEKITIGKMATNMGYYLAQWAPDLMNKIVKANFYSRRTSVQYNYNYETLSFIPAYSLDQYNESEFAVDINDFAKAVDNILEIYEKHKKTGNQLVLIINCRFSCKSSDCMLSPHFDRTTAYISITSVGKFSDSELFYNDIEKYMKSTNARPHWGKTHNYSYDDFIKLYGSNLTKFNLIRSKFDPYQIFANDYIINCLTANHKT